MGKSLVVVTFNREEDLKRLLESVDISLFDDIVVVRDGGGKPYNPKTENILNDKFVYIPQPENMGVGKCKQAGVDYIINAGKSDHIFIIEDDIIVKDNNVWDYYINFSKVTGIWHTNWNDYRYHSHKFEIDYGDGVVAAITRDVEGSFSYFHKNMFNFCEFPPDMKNAFEHISVELQLIEKDLIPQFWNFVCPKGTGDYLTHTDSESTITGKPKYTENYQNALEAFRKRHNIDVSKIPEVDRDVFMERLKFLKENYSKNES